MTDLPNHIWKQVTNEEKYTLACLSLGGPITYDSKGNGTIVMGMTAFKRLSDYKQKLIDKYDRNRSKS